ncbi:palmitoyl-protein thioesterase [Schistosoma bovis]|uniref:Palmitoyl-protein thioesterase n=1 Tax=Schistosoma bovis TaxID=6184 RepID=A0A430QGW5_SCHBO|nr:palmitoyl-protein thioesterase [Schistosoma bovis]
MLLNITSFFHFVYYTTSFVPAQYWHDPFKENVYRKYSRFLADINQENWFGFYRRGSSTDIIKLRDSILYSEDRLGLKVLDKRGDLHLIEKTGEHLNFTNQWFIDNILIRYMK